MVRQEALIAMKPTMVMTIGGFVCAHAKGTATKSTKTTTKTTA